jgi:hypothetical protein
VTEILFLLVVKLVIQKAGDKHDLLFNKATSLSAVTKTFSDLFKNIGKSVLIQTPQSPKLINIGHN